MRKRIKSIIMAGTFIFATFLPVNLQFSKEYTVETVMAEENYLAWDSNKIYNNGDIVSYDAQLWIAQWWTEGQVPGTTGEWGIWKVYNNDIATTKDTEAPTAPTEFKYVSKTNNSVNLTWSPSSDNVEVAGYEIYKDGVLAGTTSSTSYTVINLIANTTFNFIVKAKDAVGNLSSVSSAISVTTEANITEPVSKKIIALTFDDGPSATTSLVLDKLEKYNIVASFFLVGWCITDDKKPILERELSLGCEIGDHSWNHLAMNQMSSAEINSEFQKTSDAIYNLVGVRPKFFRPPYIATSNTMYEAINVPFICGMGCTDWDSSVTAEERAATFLNNAKDGDILLMHDLNGNTQTVDALDAIITGLKEKGFTFVTVSQLFEQKGVDPNPEYKLWSNVNN